MKAHVRFWALTVVVGACFAALTFAEQKLPYALQVLKSEVRQMENEVNKASKNLSQKEAKTCSNLLHEQKMELTRVEEKYLGNLNVKQSDLNKDLAAFFQYAPKIWKIIEDSTSGQVGIQQTHECQHHCYESCGRNSIGDWICYTRCVTCCTGGGCS